MNKPETQPGGSLKPVGSGPRTLEAKWLDPECWDGCQSLVLKAKVERYEKLLRRVLEWCESESQDFEIDADSIRKALNPNAPDQRPAPDSKL